MTLAVHHVVLASPKTATWLNTLLTPVIVLVMLTLLVRVARS